MVTFCAIILVLFYHLYTIINTSIGPTCSLKNQVANGVALTLLVSGSLISMQCNQPLDFSKGVRSHGLVCACNNSDQIEQTC